MTWNYGDSERIDRMLRRREREKRITFGCLSVFVLVVVIIVWRAVTGDAPPIPSVRVTWQLRPQLDSRIFTPMSIAGSRDSYFVAALTKNTIHRYSNIRLEDQSGWTIRTSSVDSNLGGSETIFCRPVAHGLQKLFDRNGPEYELRTEIIAPAPRNGGLLALPVPLKAPAKSAYILADVQVANTDAQWDERVVNLLQALPATIATPPWMLEPGFSDAPRAKTDFGTYFSTLRPDTTDLQGQLHVARALAKAAPRATIKLIATEGEGNKLRVVFRVILDGHGSRDGWLRKKGEKKAKRLLWWLMPVSAKTREGKAVPMLPEPAPPRAAAKHKPTTEPTATPEVVSPSMPAMKMKMQLP